MYDHGFTKHTEHYTWQLTLTIRHKLVKLESQTSITCQQYMVSLKWLTT